MYEGFLQHDAQEVLQCILGYMQEACDNIRKEQDLPSVDGNTENKLENGAHPESGGPMTECNPVGEEENQVSGKRKSDTEVGNAKKKPKSAKSKKAEDSKEEMRSQPLTRSKRRSSSDVTKGRDGEEEEEAEDKEIKKLHKEEEESGGDGGGEDKGKQASKEADGKTKKKSRLRWLRPSGKQPSIFSKFRSVGKISCTTPKNPNKAEEEEKEEEVNGLKTREEKTGEERPPEKLAQDKKAAKLQGGSFFKFSVFV